MTGFLGAVWDKSRHRDGITGKILHALLLPLTPGYRLGLGVSRARRSRLAAWDRRIPAVLVGNLTTGGTGKTPLAAAVAAQASTLGLRTAIVSRGYGGKRKADPAVAFCDGEAFLSAAEAGDEPLELSRLPGVGAVVVGHDRVRAAEMAVSSCRAAVLVLDDAFQQRPRFPLGWNIVALNSAEPFGNGSLLPAGSLREPVSALAAAHAVVLTHADELDGPGLDALVSRVKELAPGVVVAAASHRLAGFRPADGGDPLEPGWISGKLVMALSGIGFPEGFERMLARASGAPVACWRASDHHRWSAGELARIRAEAVRRGCAAVITTAKDRERFPKGDAGGIPILVARLRMEFVRGREAFEGALGAYLRSYA